MNIQLEETGNLDPNLLESNTNYLISNPSLPSTATQTPSNQASTIPQLESIEQMPYIDNSSSLFFGNTPGNTPQEALYIGSKESYLWGMYSDYLTIDNSSDYYVFKLPEVEGIFSHFGSYSVNINLSQLYLDSLQSNSNVNIQLLDQNQHPLSSNYYWNSYYYDGLNPGTYYLKVSSDNNLSQDYLTQYSFNIWGSTIMPACIPDNAGNTRETARNIQLNSSNTTYKDWISTNTNNYYADIYDYYKFTLAESAYVNLKLDGLSGNANLELLNENNQLITRSINSGTNPESMETFLSKGIYYIRVLGGNDSNEYFNSTNYNLTTSAIFTESEYNNSRVNADIIQLDPDYTKNSLIKFTGSIDEEDSKDFYKFTLNQAPGVTVGVTIKLDSLTDDLDLRLLDQNGNQINFSKLGGTQSETIKTSLTSGTYYIQVIPWVDTTSNYTLSIQAGAFSDAYEYNNLSFFATPIFVNSAPQTYKASLHQGYDYDYYRFTLNQRSDFRLTLNGLISDADVVILDPFNNYIAGSFNSFTSNEYIDINLAAGNYYLCVYPYQDKVTEYNLTLQALPPVRFDV